MVLFRSWSCPDCPDLGPVAGVTTEPGWEYRLAHLAGLHKVEVHALERRRQA